MIANTPTGEKNPENASNEDNEDESYASKCKKEILETMDRMKWYSI